MPTRRETYLLERCLRLKALVLHPPRPRIFTPFDWAMARSLRKQGLSIARVAGALQVGRETVRRWEG
jgi:hypothetical protein